jgi:choline dehydrogenase-like flavoprotein
MAGHRRTKGPRTADGSVHPTAARGRAERINKKMMLRYAQATTDLERLAAVVDYVRSAAATTGRTEPGRTKVVLDGLIVKVLHAGDELLKLKVRSR